MASPQDMSFATAAPLTGNNLSDVRSNARAYFDHISVGGAKLTKHLVGTLCGGEERGGPLYGFLCEHPHSDRLCLADVFFSSYHPLSGGPVTNSFYNFRELSARPDVSPAGGEGGYYLAIAVGMHRQQQGQDNGRILEQWHRNNSIMAKAGIAKEYERGKVPYKPLLVLPGSDLLYQAGNLDAAMCGGLPTLTFDFHVNQAVTIKDIATKPEYNGRPARVTKLPSDPNDPEGRYEVFFTDGAEGPLGFRARARNLDVKTEPAEAGVGGGASPPPPMPADAVEDAAQDERQQLVRFMAWMRQLWLCEQPEVFGLPVPNPNNADFEQACAKALTALRSTRKEVKEAEPVAK